MESDPSLLARIMALALAVVWNWKDGVAVLFLVAGPVLQLFRPDGNIRRTLDKTLPLEPTRRRILIFLCFIFLFVSLFQVYDDVTLRLRAAQHDLLQLRNRDATKQQLEKFYLSIGEILDKNLPKDISDEDFQKYIDEANSRVNDAGEWIKKSMGEPAQARFLDVSGMLAATVPRAANKTHNQIILTLTKLKHNLAEMIQSPAWDR
jgi:hypothetical protein